MKKQVKGWLDFAYSDLLVSKEIIDNPYLTHMVAFHSQQAIEKSFKAILEEKESSVPKIHNLITLYQHIRKYVEIDIDFTTLKLINQTLKLINQAYIDTRYPADIGLLPDGIPSAEEAQKMYACATDIYEAIKKTWA